jgi:hypothetical protein
MALAAHAVTFAAVRGFRHTLTPENIPHRFCGAVSSDCAVVGGPLDNRMNNETLVVARTPFMQFLKALSSDVRLCQPRDMSVAVLTAEPPAASSRRKSLPIPTGGWGNTPLSPATRKFGKATSSSRASTARLITRAIWRAAPLKGGARGRRFWRRSRAKPPQSRSSGTERIWRALIPEIHRSNS